MQWDQACVFPQESVLCSCCVLLRSCKAIGRKSVWSAYGYEGCCSQSQTPPERCAFWALTACGLSEHQSPPLPYLLSAETPCVWGTTPRCGAGLAVLEMCILQRVAVVEWGTQKHCLQHSFICRHVFLFPYLDMGSLLFYPHRSNGVVVSPVCEKL